MKKIFMIVTEDTNLSNISQKECYAIVKSVSQTFFKTLLNIKSNNPNFHVLWDITSTFLYNVGIFQTIKSAINYGVDGFFISAIEIEHILEVNKLINCLTRLPKPYNLNWDVYVCNQNQEHIINKSGVIHCNTTAINISLSIELY
jgi:translation elongation factor EF-G